MKHFPYKNILNNVYRIQIILWVMIITSILKILLFIKV
jgi:hypothetical protein